MGFLAGEGGREGEVRECQMSKKEMERRAFFPKSKAGL